MNDQQIITLFQTGKREKAFRYLYRLYPKIERMVLSYGGQKADALDVFQETLIVVYTNLRKDDFKLTCSFYTYLYAVSRYRWKDINKQKEPPAPEIAHWEEALEQEEQFQLAEKAFASLGERCRNVLNLFYQEGLSFKKIASRLGFSSDKSAKNQKYKCLTKAKDIYQQQRNTVSF